VIKGLLERNTGKRLGSKGASEIKLHPFFQGLHWKNLLNGKVEPPFRPKVPKGVLDTSNFDNDYTNQPAVETPIETVLTDSQNQLFQGFSYVRSPSDFGTPPSSNYDNDNNNKQE